MTIDSARRRFIGGAAIALAVVPFAPSLAGIANAATLPKLPVDQPQAKALAYTPDARTTTHPGYKPGSNCANCQFFTAATSACALFAGFAVEPAGWCSAWSKKA
jgi:hypothetical protein